MRRNQEAILKLCEEIPAEKDTERLLALVKQLNQLLEENHSTLAAQKPASPDNDSDLRNFPTTGQVSTDAGASSKFM